MCPMPCLQEAVAQSKEAANILMSPAERMLLQVREGSWLIQVLFY